ncbi:MAG: M23 family metallopeptidase [Deltaproteobacteria bacterium]|nr:M23 family metallopeptidase [Deltaproteobacteria bacterium]MBW2537131.1 M23 family metallopeptidase [Deltaproteobacteria bacterium]
MAWAVASLGCDGLGLGGSATSSAASAFSSGAPSSGAAPSGPTAASGAAVTTPPPKADPSRLKLRGKPVQGGLLLATVEPKTRGLKFPGHRAVVSEQGDFLIAFYRNAPPREKLTITFPDGAVLEHDFEVEQREYEDDVIDGLPKGEVVLDVETKKRLHASNQRIEGIRNRYTKTAYYHDGFDWPVVGRVTSRYGQQRILNGVKSGLHWGIDIAAPAGTPVKAPAGGTVVFAEKNVPLSGHVLIVDHGHGLSSTFLHLSGFTVTVGKEVARGDVIGSVGMTGRATGPHLDWRANFFQIRIDPELLVEQQAWRATPAPGPDAGVE